jgi:hypothetical protein
VAGERRPVIPGLVQRDAERELIGARVDRQAEVLLGRHVARRAHDRAGPGQGHVQLEVLPPDRAGRADPPRLVVDGGDQAEVGDPDPAIVADQHVVGLEVAVDQAGVVRGLQPSPGPPYIARIARQPRCCHV